LPLLSNSVQPALLTLLNSSSSPPLSPLFRRRVDRDLPADSTVCVLRDDDDPVAPVAPLSVDGTPTPGERVALVPRSAVRGSTGHRVIHVQSPTVRTTYIQAGAPSSSASLGVELPWLGLQIKRLGRREFAFEIGVRDRTGVQGIIRFSTFQKTPRLHLPPKPPSLPILLVPIHLPQLDSPTLLTQWLELLSDVPSLLPSFHNGALVASPPPADDDDDEEPLARAPRGAFGCVSYVRVYANCRVRRIWFARERERGVSGGEWGLYASRQGVTTSEGRDVSMS